ncbi:MAG: polysaccharide deacetylase family protein [bacterium]|nr:polysaccharide deacetylase family protein [bacterium]
MNLQEENEKILSFIKVGIAVLSIIAIFGLGINYVPNAITVTSGSTQKKLPIYCVDTDKKQVAISFDAAWGNEQTQGLLDCLKKYNVKATFFMTGGWISKYPEDVKNIYAAGHDLGNHSENHKQMSKLSASQCTSELTSPHKKVKELVGIDMILFRPPFGDYNNTLIDSVHSLGYQCVQWDVDSLDWKDYDAKTITNRILKDKHLGNGSIILMHNGGKHTLEALPSIIEGLQKEGYELVKISDLILTKDYEMDQEGRQHQAKP